jgi:hypothetical protein
MARVTHCDHMTAVDLVDLEAQPLSGDPALELERKHPIVRPVSTRVGTSGQAGSGQG